MKTSFFGLGMAVAVASVNAMDYEVASCAELAGIDDNTVTSLTITSTPFQCESYTRFPVRNDMVLKSDAAVEFSNFALKVLGTLTVEPDVTFGGVTNQMTKGGALYVDKGSSATFMGTARFIGNSVITKIRPSTQSSDGRFRSNIPRGGAVFNKGELVFEGTADFVDNETTTTDSTDLGRGGAIYNARIGSITFNAQLTATENNADGFFAGQGGVIFNAGDIVVASTSSFTENTAADGGAIYMHPTGTMTFNDFATFTENRCFENRGGAILSFGSLTFSDGSLFLSNFADSSGDGGSGGAIYNGGNLQFRGFNTFDNNWGLRGGAIYNTFGAIMSDFEDFIFENLRGEICLAIYYAPESSSSEPECAP